MVRKKAVPINVDPTGGRKEQFKKATQAGKQEQDAKLVLGMAVKDVAVFAVDLDAVTFNPINGRFAAELAEHEAERNRGFDIDNPNDVEEIEHLLLEEKDKANHLEKSILQHGQLEEAVSTSEGILINGNRRLAVLRRIWKRTKDPKYKTIRVAVLPENVTPRDIWILEAGYQLSPDLKTPYGPINEMLKLREGKDRGLEVEEMAFILGSHITKDYVDKRLEILDLAEGYLDYIGRPRKYSLLEQGKGKLGASQKLEDLRMIKARMERQRFSKGVIQDIITIAYEYIRTKATFNDVRDLGRSFSTEEQAKQVIKELQEALPGLALRYPYVEDELDADDLEAILEEDDAPTDEEGITGELDAPGDQQRSDGRSLYAEAEQTPAVDDQPEEPEPEDEPEHEDESDEDRDEIRGTIQEVVAANKDRVQAKKAKARPATMISAIKTKIDQVEKLDRPLLQPHVDKLREVRQKLDDLIKSLGD